MTPDDMPAAHVAQVPAVFGLAAGEQVERPGWDATSWSWVARCAVTSSLALLAVSVAQGAGRRDEHWGEPLYWLATGALFLLPAIRIISPSTARLERVMLFAVLAEASFALKLLYSPTTFVDFDEFAHWITARDIVERGHLFIDNALLPISPLYPGLEIVTSALAELAGAPIFPTSIIINLVIRVLFVWSIFLFYIRVSGSERLAATACLIFMGNPNYVLFHSLFSYESLGFALLALILLLESLGRRPLGVNVLLLALIGSLTLTHHVSAYVAAAFLVGYALLSLTGPADPGERARSLLVACVAVAVPLLWSSSIGNRSVSYLEPVLDEGISQLVAFVQGDSLGRGFFVATDGARTPLALQLIAVSSLALVCLGLAIGFFPALRLATGAVTALDAARGAFRAPGRNVRLALFSCVTILFPLSIALRLTPSGWEVGNRMGPFVFLGVAIVVATGWETIRRGGRTARRWSLWGGATATVIALGGIIAGPSPIGVHRPYTVGGDGLSIEGLGIRTALWARDWLGGSNNFAADRTNRLLLASYGRQGLVTTLNGGPSTAEVFVSKGMSPSDQWAIATGRVDYILVDLRMVQSLPRFGVYFEAGEPDHIHVVPPAGSALLKFDHLARVSRVYDNGWITIFDVRGLRRAQ